MTQPWGLTVQQVPPDGVVVTDVNGNQATVTSSALNTTGSASAAAAVNPTGETAGVGIGAAADVEAAANGSGIAVLKRLRTLLAAGLPAALVGGRLSVDGSGVTQPVSLAANQSVNMSQWGGTGTTLGQKAMSASVPVTVASDQTGTADVTASGTLGAINDAVTINAQGLGGVSFEIDAGLSAILTAEVSADGGTSWLDTQLVNVSTGSFNATTTVTGAALAHRSIAMAGGGGMYRVRVSTYTSGSATARLRAGVAALSTPFPVRTNGSASASASLQVGGTDGTNNRRLEMRNAAPAATDYGLVTRPLLPSYTRSDTYTAAASGTTVDATAASPKVYAIQVTPTGAVTSWDVRLEGSLDNVTFTQILAHTNVTGSGVTVWSGTALSPSLYIRSRAAGLVLGGGTNIVTVILGTP